MRSGRTGYLLNDGSLRTQGPYKQPDARERAGGQAAYPTKDTIPETARHLPCRSLVSGYMKSLRQRARSQCFSTTYRALAYITIRNIYANQRPTRQSERIAKYKYV